VATRISKPKELVLHFAVAKLLREHCREDWIWTHIPSGEKRDIITARKLKNMGVQPGWPDFLLVNPFGEVHFLELKREGKKLTGSQNDIRVWCISHAIAHSIAYNVDDILRIFASWECLDLSITIK
jgi:hypothetical protein